MEKPANLPNLIFRDDGTIMLKNVRASYLHIWKPWSKNEINPQTGKPEQKKFTGTGMMPEASHTAEIKALRDYATALYVEKFKSKPKPDTLFIRNGDDSGKEQYENHWICVASESADHPPKVVGRDPKQKLREEDGKPKSGHWVNLLIRPWIQDNDTGKRVNANLLAIQFVKEDEVFGRDEVDAEDAFDALEDEFQDEDL